jgi:uncharacterized protein (TIRG00374 family)
MRRWIYWLLIIGFFAVVIIHFNEFTDFSRILARGQFQWMFAAIALQLLHYLVSSASYRVAFNTVGVHTRLRDLVPLLFGALFVNVVAPTGGASGAALFVDHAARNGESPVRTAAGILLQLIISMLAVVVILAAGLSYMGTQHRLLSYHIIASVILVVGFGLITGLLLLAVRRPAFLTLLFTWLQRIVNKLSKRIKRIKAISDEWVEEHVIELMEAGAAVAKNPRKLAFTLAILLLAHVINLAVLYTLFLSFSLSIPIGSLVAGYAIGLLFLIVSITPQGVGVVEGIMPLVFHSFGIPTGIATLTVLAFRGLTFWLPLLVGFLLLRRMDLFRKMR